MYLENEHLLLLRPCCQDKGLHSKNLEFSSFPYNMEVVMGSETRGTWLALEVGKLWPMGHVQPLI